MGHGSGHGSYELLVEHLGVAHRAREARRALLAAGAAATPAVRRGLGHHDPAVVVGCCDVLDASLDEDALPELFACLGHDDPQVRARALHALACDACKQGACRPGEGRLIRAAVRATTDPVAAVRVAAVQALGPASRRSADALAALERCAQADAHPPVRKIARWFLPGGPVYEGRRTKSGRRRVQVSTL